jgi:glycine hydroxymethyltransferase
MTLARRSWVPAPSEDLVQTIAGPIADQDAATLLARIDALAEKNREIHERDCFNLNPAANVMNPRAEALLSSRLGSRAPRWDIPATSTRWGWRRSKRSRSSPRNSPQRSSTRAMQRFAWPPAPWPTSMPSWRPAAPATPSSRRPPPSAGMSPTTTPGCAGLYGLRILPAPVAQDGYTVDTAALEFMARTERPRLITIGGSLNLDEHPVAELRAIADEVGATLLFDAAHQCGIIAGPCMEKPADRRRAS